MTVQISTAAGRDRFVGSAVSRVDGPAKVTGLAKYAGEFAAPDLAYGVVVSSAVAKGSIRSIDASAAEAVPGVIKVITHENRPATSDNPEDYQDAVAPPARRSKRWRPTASSSPASRWPSSSPRISKRRATPPPWCGSITGSWRPAPTSRRRRPNHTIRR
ncbi:hypothetical protein GCM10025880_36140 [Methylorubrum aminovorans]|nr:hypothetical protein GCM10025880_36140 [Methylorubrum aminovorans]